MSIASEIERISDNIAGSYAAVSGKGGTLPVNQNSDNLADAIDTIPTGTTPTGTKSITANGVYDVTDFASADVQVPTTAPAYYIEKTVDASGKLTGSPNFINLNGVKDFGQQGALSYAYNRVVFPANTTIDMSSLEKITGAYALQYAFENSQNITTVLLNNLENISSNYACTHAFQSCSLLTSVNLSNLRTISGTNSCEYMFMNCSSLDNVDLSPLKEIKGFACCTLMFQNCVNLQNINLSNLELSSSTNTLGGTFDGCRNLKSISFDSLYSMTQVISPSYQAVFSNCLNLESVSFGGFRAGTFASKKDQIAYLFNSATGSTAPNGCTVHFPSNFDPSDPNHTFDASTLTGYPTFGGNASYIHVAFDLPNPGPITTDLSYVERVETGNEFQDAYRYNTIINAFDLSNLVLIKGASGCQRMFQGCTGLSTASLPKLEVVSSYAGFAEGFQNCSGIKSFNLDRLTKTTGAYAISHLFDGADITGDVFFKSLQTIYNTQPLQGCFMNCTNITSVSFPALRQATTDNFWQMLNGTTGKTVHFPSNLSGSITNCGGTNTIILFDLPATVILTGANAVHYERNPIDDIATALAWRKNQYDSDGLVVDWTSVYTNGTTDPAVGDTVYSDSACTTAVTTISSIA